MKFSTLLAWIIGVPVIAIICFYLLNIISYQEPAEKFQRYGNVEELIRQAKTLEKELAENPQKIDKLLPLAHIYQEMGQYPKAIIAYGKAWEKVKGSPDELIRFAKVLALQGGNNFIGKPLKLINKALNINSRNIDGLILHGTAMLQQKDIRQAIKDWTKANSLLPEKDPRKAELERMLQKLTTINKLD